MFESVRPSAVAQMFATPAWTAVTFSPAVTVATTVLDDDHTAESVTFLVAPLESVVVAVNCAEAPVARLDDPVTATDVTVGVGVALGVGVGAGLVVVVGEAGLSQATAVRATTRHRTLRDRLRARNVLIGAKA